ncbi:hypothetical protein BKA81DRAFT_380023 [Phyllosticta paracitricarpa]
MGRAASASASAAAGWARGPWVQWMDRHTEAAAVRPRISITVAAVHLTHAPPPASPSSSTLCLSHSRSHSRSVHLGIHTVVRPSACPLTHCRPVEQLCRAVEPLARDDGMARVSGLLIGADEASARAADGRTDGRMGRYLLTDALGLTDVRASRDAAGLFRRYLMIKTGVLCLSIN